MAVVRLAKNTKRVNDEMTAVAQGTSKRSALEVRRIGGMTESELKGAGSVRICMARFPP